MEFIRLGEKLHAVIQGEGKNTGQKMVVVRVAGCPVKCMDCDSSHTWSTENTIEFDQKKFYSAIKSACKKFNTNHIMLTGGEPGLYTEFIKDFMEKYQDKHEWKWDIETAGVFDLTDLYEWESNIQFNFSPKIGALTPANALELKGLKVLPINYICKTVVSKETFEADKEAIKKLQEDFSIEDEHIYLMPKGTDKATITRESKWLMKQVFKLPYNFSFRAHILIFNKKKMV